MENWVRRSWTPERFAVAGLAALVITCAFFGFWHLPNFFGLPAGYVLFQLFYTGVLGLIPGLSRQWTGSIVYVVLTHSAMNFIAWAVS